MWAKILLNSRYGGSELSNSVGIFDKDKADQITQNGKIILNELQKKIRL